VKILGVDPGSRVTGWGLVSTDGWDLTFVAHGVVKTGARLALPDRLRLIADGLEAVIGEHGPEAMAVEQVFAAKNARSALVLGHARGVALLSASRAGLSFHEYSPMQVKSSVTGYGRSEKEQVQRAVATQLCLRELPAPFDASDALAVALCHAAASRMSQRLAAGDAPGSPS
jgi:crossover junction endodeoxyribonuclease RuvC